MGQNIQNKTAQFIEKAIKVHGKKFDYSLVEYSGSHTKVSIVCTEHGVFYQTPTGHLSGNGCPNCAAQNVRGKYRLTTFETFLSQAKEIHGDRYDYSKVNWKNTSSPITIVCRVHGEFTQLPQNHIRLKCGCRKCGRLVVKNKLNKYNSKYFIEKAKEIHGDKYDYSKVQCFGATDKVTIICSVHGEFEQLANQHLRRHGCPNCNFDQMANDRAMGKDVFILKAKKLFGEKYDYTKVEYKNGQTNVCLICSDHGEFEVTPNNHLSKKSGCPVCNQSKLERRLASILDNKNIKFERQKRFAWLGRQSLDLFLPEYGIGIECQGIQHFKPVDFAGKGEKWANNAFEEVKERDDVKLKKCLYHNVKLIYVVDNDEFIDNAYHLNIVAPFSGNVSYEIIHVQHFENYLEHLVSKSNFFGQNL